MPDIFCSPKYFLPFICVVEYVSHLFLLTAKEYPIVQMHHDVEPPVDGYLGRLQALAIIIKVAMNVRE